LYDRNGQRLKLADAERDLERLYGWTIPVESLKYWALGIPDPGTVADVAVDNDGRLASVRQRGWVVTVDRYRQYAGDWMPARITAESASTRVRLVVDDWAFFEQL
jgi:outer membrane lipoprotein LolB